MRRIAAFRRLRLRRAAVVGSLLAGMGLCVGLLVVLVDVGLYSTARSDLQDAADAAALEAAMQRTRADEQADQTALATSAATITELSRLNGIDVRIERGAWNPRRRRFTPGASPYNAARVTLRGRAARAPAAKKAGWMLAALPVTPTTTAVAALRPRDIVLVVDLSGMMNDDSEPCWAAGALDALYPSAGADSHDAGRGSQLGHRIYRDLGWGDYPGPVERLGQPWGVVDGPRAHAALAANAGPLASRNHAPPYRIEPNDDAMTRKRKVYSAVIDYQIARLMPAAVPKPDSAAHYAFWEQYLDYVVPANVAGPPDQSPYRITGFRNPDPLRFPNVGYPQSFISDRHGVHEIPPCIGYATFLQFLLDHGRDLRPGGRVASPYARSSPLCRTHQEDTPAGVTQFLASEQPLHAVRRALVAAIDRLARHNAAIADPAQRDRVAVVTFDTLAGGARVAHPLDGDYAAAMHACTRLQAVGDKGPASAVELGLQSARDQLAGRSGPRRDRPAEKLVVLLSGSPPDLYTASCEQIDALRRETPGDVFLPGDAYPANAAIAEALRIAQAGASIHAMGVGPRADRDFLDRLARAGKTADAAGRAPKPPLDPAAYEVTLIEHLTRALDQIAPRIVQ